MLEYEAKLYKKLENQPGFASVHWNGIEGDFKVLIVDLLGPSIDQLFEFCGKKFETNTIMWLAI
jgi:hypothetical protein